MQPTQKIVYVHSSTSIKRKMKKIFLLLSIISGFGFATSPALFAQTTQEQINLTQCPPYDHRKVDYVVWKNCIQQKKEYYRKKIDCRALKANLKTREDILGLNRCLAHRKAYLQQFKRIVYNEKHFEKTKKMVTATSIRFENCTLDANGRPTTCRPKTDLIERQNQMKKTLYRQPTQKAYIASRKYVDQLLTSQCSKQPRVGKCPEFLATQMKKTIQP